MVEKNLGHMLAQAETMRLRADYDIGIQISKDECESILNHCELFLRKIREIISTLS